MISTVRRHMITIHGMAREEVDRLTNKRPRMPYALSPVRPGQGRASGGDVSVMAAAACLGFSGAGGAAHDHQYADQTPPHAT